MSIEVVAPMGGKIVTLAIKVGDKLEEDEEILAMEAMKMEMPVVSPQPGVVSQILVSPGEAVEANQVLAIID